MELRERVVEAVDQQPGTVSEIAHLFGSTERYVDKLRKQRQERGELSPLPHGGGARPPLREEKKGRVGTLVAKAPAAPVAELRGESKKKLHVEVRMGTGWNLLASLGLPRTKSPAALVRQTRKRARPAKSNTASWRAAG